MEILTYLEMKKSYSLFRLSGYYLVCDKLYDVNIIDSSILPITEVCKCQFLKVNLKLGLTKWTVNTKSNNFFKGFSFIINWAHIA